MNNAVIRHQDGFSLLEVLVAFAILALSLGVLMQIFSGGMRNSQVTGDYSRAIDLAETALARVGTELPPTAGVRNGTESKFQWTLEALPYQLNGFIAPPQDVNLYQVTARVSWADLGGAHQVALCTLRIFPRL